MQKDFHYYCIAVLSRAAGFNVRDALTIAYASQYTDDATESSPISLTDSYGKVMTKFDPVRTSYIGLNARSWSIQKQVFVPFHFIPPEPFIYLDPTNYLGTHKFIVEPQSLFARYLLHEAGKEKNAKRGLCRIGIALHMLADTWAHQGFSGRSSDSENSIEEIEILEKTGELEIWKKDYFTDYLVELSVMSSTSEEIGHAEAGFLPDLSFITWKYRNSDGVSITRNNTDIYMDAAEAIYVELIGLEKSDPVKPISWDEIKGPIRNLFENPGSVGEKISLLEMFKMYLSKKILDDRCHKWEDSFGEYFGDESDKFTYHHRRWRNEALDPRHDDLFFDPERATWEMEREIIEIYNDKNGFNWSDWYESFDDPQSIEFNDLNTDWDDWSPEEFQVRAKYPLKPSFPDSYWVHFHRAALKHRSLVLEHLP